MADLSELETKFLKADALAQGGDEQAKADASLFAGEIKRLRDIKPQTTDPRAAAIERMNAKPWGSGAAQGAYDAGGKVTELASKVLPNEVAAGLGTATNFAAQAIPALFGGSVAGSAAAPVMESAATSLMSSAIKPILKDLKSGKAATAIQTLLDEGITATKGGMEKLRGMIGDLNYEVANKIRNSTAVVDKAAVWNAVKPKLDQFAMQVSPQKDTATIKAVWDDFMNNPLAPGQTLPVQLAQDMKQGTYRVLSKKYGQLGTADDEAQKAIARGLKDEVGKAVPDVLPLNARESELINALKVGERKVLLDANKNPMGFALIAHNPFTWAAFMADRSAAFKSLAAIMLHRNSASLPGGVAAGGIVGAQNIQGQ